jgi:transposase
LLGEPEIGPYTAAVILTSWSHPGRVRTGAAFARLAGTTPIPASSGNRSNHHGLDRGGDRRLNKALHIAALVRMCHLARKIFKLLTRTNALAVPA